MDCYPILQYYYRNFTVTTTGCLVLVTMTEKVTVKQTLVINTDHNGKTSNVIIRHNITYKNSARNCFFHFAQNFQS